ncbi:MAG: hypothetical protein AAF581_10445 [Planctomycetota bacterium]
MIALRFFGHVAAAFGALCFAVWLWSQVTGDAVVAEPDDKRVPIALVACTFYGTLRTTLHYVGARDQASATGGSSSDI